jgi:hypothetical protein
MHHGTASMHWQTMCSSLLLLRQRYFPVHMPKLNAVEAKTREAYRHAHRHRHGRQRSTTALTLGLHSLATAVTTLGLHWRRP